MKFERHESESATYATNLRQNKNSEKLEWDSANGTDALLVQTAYGETVKMEDLCQGLEKNIKNIEEFETMRSSYVQILPEVWCRYVSAIEKARNNGCVINGKPATYTVFACVFDKNTGIGKIYEPSNGGMIKPSYDIQVQCHIEVVRETERKGIGIFRKQVETGFYSLNFPEDSYDGYQDGDFAYSVDGFEVPITKEMFRQKKVYVKTEQKPDLKPKNKGLCLI